MKASTSILTGLAFAIFSVMKAALASQEPCPTTIACDACSEGGLWGIFPRAHWNQEASTISPQAPIVPLAACFTTYAPGVSTIGCPCLFNAQTEIPAIVGYIPTDNPVAVGFVQVAWTANAGDAVGGQMDVSVYSDWVSSQPGNIGQSPLIGSLDDLGVSAPTTESYTIFSTLPDPITFDVVATANNGPLLINLAGTYGDQNLTFPSIESNTTQTLKAPFEIAVPVSEWWYAAGINVPSV